MANFNFKEIFGSNMPENWKIPKNYGVNNDTNLPTEVLFSNIVVYCLQRVKGLVIERNILVKKAGFKNIKRTTLRLYEIKGELKFISGLFEELKQK